MSGGCTLSRLVTHCQGVVTEHTGSRDDGLVNPPHELVTAQTATDDKHG